MFRLVNSKRLLSETGRFLIISVRETSLPFPVKSQSLDTHCDCLSCLVMSLKPHTFFLCHWPSLCVDMRPGKLDQPLFSLSSIHLQPKQVNKTVFSFKRGTLSSLGLEEMFLLEKKCRIRRDFLLHCWCGKILSGDLMVF